MISNDEFQKMPFEAKVSYLTDNLGNLPDEIAQQGIDILAQAGEIEYAVILARDKGLIQKAIEILVKAGDYLWAALIAKNAGLTQESEQLYREGLDYYIGMEMYGRAVSAATALKMPQDEIDELFRRGVETESRGMDMGPARAMIENAMDSLEIAVMGREDETSKDLMNAIESERRRREGQSKDNIL
ncbi:MAG: hypothetical protein ACE14P_13095 [Methanotrichaceae archaeon]